MHRRHLPLLALFTCSLLSAQTPERNREMLAEKPVVLPGVTISEKTARRVVYEAKVEKLSDLSYKSRSISYLQVLEAAYDTTKFDLIQCLLAKKAYRETTAKSRPFHCNYGAATIEVKIRWRSTQTNLSSGKIQRGAGTTTRGLGFDYRTREITLSPEAPFQFLLHASGAALSGFPSAKTAEDIKNSVTQKQAEHFSTHVEFELQLQDLNRYYATFTGRPIMTPLDAVHALAMFGHPPSHAVVAKILERNGIAATAAAIDKARTTEKVKRDGRTGVFELAYRLVDGYSALGLADDMTGDGTMSEDIVRYQVADGLNQKSREEYETLLEQIIIEAPGHI